MTSICRDTKGKVDMRKASIRLEKMSDKELSIPGFINQELFIKWFHNGMNGFIQISLHQNETFHSYLWAA